MGEAAKVIYQGEEPKLYVRRSDARGREDYGWLDTRHTFSFAGYYDPRFTSFRNLLVLNEDRVMPGGGFPTHHHDNMEIISVVLEGELAHRDNMGNGSVIRPDEVQLMTAGKGITHSEVNPSKTDLLHFLQIWILPNMENLPPGYQQKKFQKPDPGKLQLLVSANAEDGSVSIHQNVRIYRAYIALKDELTYEVPSKRYAWLQVMEGRLAVNENQLSQGDGLAVLSPGTLTIQGADNSNSFLLFDLN